MTNEEIINDLHELSKKVTGVANKGMIINLKNKLKLDSDDYITQKQVNEINELRKAEHDKQQARKQARANGNR